MKKMKNKIMVWSAAISTLAVLAYSKVVLAEVEVPTGGTGGLNDLEGDFSAVVDSLINKALLVLGGVAVLIILYGGFLILFGGENEEYQKKGKKLITYTIVGIIVIVLAAFIVKFALSIFT